MSRKFVVWIGCRPGAKPAFAELKNGKSYDMMAGNSPGYIG